MLDLLRRDAPVAVENLRDALCEKFPGQVSLADVREALTALAAASAASGNGATSQWRLGTAAEAMRRALAASGAVANGRAKAAAPKAPPPPSAPAPGQTAQPTAGAAPARAGRTAPARWVPTDEQRAVLEASPDALLLVEAGPGTGKTAVACARVASLLERNIAPTSIMMLSFTRTAIAELRARIAAMARDVAPVAAVRITTVDSQAWYLGVGSGGHIPDKLHRGFEANIAEATALLKARDASMEEWVQGFRHLIIDEAQDLVGARAELVLALLGHLSEECGVTVFADRAQAIFGFSVAEDDETDQYSGAPAPSRSFHERFVDEFPGVRKLALTRVFRAADPNLKALFDDGRRQVLASGPAPQRIDKLKAHVERAARKVPALDARAKQLADGELVLYRRRNEVLVASGFLCSAGVPHRIRLPSTPLGFQPWVALLFASPLDPLIARAAFDSLWSREAASAYFQGVGRDDAWTLLLKLAGTPDGKAVDVRGLRRLLARPRPPLELAQTEVGHVGPILGTVHASKGREADAVSFYLPHPQAMGPNPDPEEELRILYVGATRARTELSIGEAYKAFGRKKLSSGRRYFGKVEKRSAQVELGRDGDFDSLSVVSRTTMPSAKDAALAQELLRQSRADVLPVVGHQRSDNFQFRLCVQFSSKEVAIGEFNPVVSTDLLDIANRVMGSGAYKAKPSLYHLFLMGVRGCAIADDDSRLSQVLEPWASSGFFLAPIVRGMAHVAFTYKKKYRRNHGDDR